jgi:hypothetical protein
MGSSVSGIICPCRQVHARRVRQVPDPPFLWDSPRAQVGLVRRFGAQNQSEGAFARSIWRMVSGARVLSRSGRQV